MTQSEKPLSPSNLFDLFGPDLALDLDITEASVTIDEQQRVVALNPAALRMFGYQPEQILGQPLGQLIPQRFRHAHATHIAAFEASGEAERRMSMRGTVTARRSNGDEFEVYASVSRVVQWQQALAGPHYTALLHEPTEKSRLKAQIFSLQARFRELLELAPIAIWIVENDRIVFANRVCLSLFGVTTVDALVGRPIYSLLAPESCTTVRQATARVLNGEVDLPLVLERIVGPNGSFRDVEIAIAGLPDHGRTTVQMVIHDITRRNTERSMLEQSRYELRHLSASLVEAREEERRRIARELHDELGQRLSWLKMELATLETEPRRRAQDARIASMLEMLDETMASVRQIATDLRPLMLDDLGLNAAIEWLARESARRMGIEVTVRLGDTDPPLDSRGATTIYRIVQEALTNVARHARATDVAIELQHHTSDLVLTVQDNGVGFPPSASSKLNSFGLLGIRERVTLLGGHMAVDNPPGGGGRITVRLPLPKPAEPSGQSRPESL